MDIPKENIKMNFSAKNHKYQQFMKQQNQNLTKAAQVINNQKFNLKFNENRESETNVQMSERTRKDRLMIKLEMKEGQKRAAQNSSENRNKQNYQTTSGFLPQYVNKFSGQFTSVNKTPWKFRNYGPNGLLKSEQIQKLQSDKSRQYHSTAGRTEQDYSDLQVQRWDNLMSKQRQSFERLDEKIIKQRESEPFMGIVETQHNTNASDSLVNFKNQTPQKTNTIFNSTRNMPFQYNTHHAAKSSSNSNFRHIMMNQNKSQQNFKKASSSKQQSRNVYNLIDNLKSLSAVKKLKLNDKRISSSLDVINQQSKVNSVSMTQIKPKLKFDTSLHQLDTMLDTNYAKQHQQGPNVAEIEKQFEQTLGSFNQSGKTIKSNLIDKRQQIKMGSYKSPIESQLSIIQNKNINHSLRKIPQLSKKKDQIIKSVYKKHIPYQSFCSHKQQYLAMPHNARKCSSDEEPQHLHDEESSCSEQDDNEKSFEYEKMKVTFNKEQKLNESSSKQFSKRGAMTIRKTHSLNFHDELGIENDEVHVNKYFMKDNVSNMITFLDKQVIERKEDNLVEHAITEIAQQVGIPRENIQNDVRRHKKVSKHNKKKFEAENPDPEANRQCSVNEIAKYGKKAYPTIRNEEHEHDECDHNYSEKEKIMLFMKGYEKYVKYQYNLKKCETDKFARRAVFGKFESNPFLKIMQEIHEEDHSHTIINFEKIEKDNSFQTKKPLRMSSSAKKFLNGIHKQVNDDIYEMRKRLDHYNNESNSKSSARDDDDEFSKLSKIELIKKLGQFKHMLPMDTDKKNTHREDYFDKIAFLNHHRKQDISVEQQNRNNQEIYRLQYVENVIIDRIRQKQIRKEIFNMKDLTPEEAREKKTDVEHKDEQIQQSLFNMKEQSSQKLIRYSIYKKMLFVPHGIEATADEVGIQSINYDENLDKEQTTFKDRDQTSTFYDLVQQNNATKTKETLFFQKSKWGSAAVQPYYKFIKNNKFKLQNKMLNIGYASAIADYIQSNEDINLHLLEIHFDECSMGDEEFAVILASISKSRYFQTSIQKISYTNNIIGQKSINQLDKLLSNSSKHRSIKELSLLNVLHANDATALSDLHLLSQCLIGKQLQQLKLQKMNLNDDKFVSNLCSFIDQNHLLRNLKLSQCQLQPKQVSQVVQALVVRELLLFELDLSGNVLISQKGLQSDQVILEIVNNIVSLITNPTCLQVLNLQGMGLKQHILTLIDAVNLNPTLRFIDFSANQLNHLDEEYIHKVLSIENKNDQFHQQQLYFDNDKYFLKTWEKFNARHIYGYEEDVDEDEIQKSRLINQNVMKELKKEKQIEASSRMLGKMNEVSIIQNKEQESIVLKRDVFNSEFITNVIGQDLSETNNFNKPCQWRKCLKNEEEPQNCEYVMMILEKNAQMEEVRDQKIIDMFRKMYHLEILKEKQGKKDTIRENPIVFGSLTNWKPVQALKLYQYVTAISCQGSNERNILNNFVFDSANYNIQTWFPLTYNALYSSLQSIVEEKQPMMVGLGIDTSVNHIERSKKFSRQNTIQQNLMKSSYIFSAYAPPGRHSIFLYDPSDDSYYQRNIFVEVKSVVEQQKYWMDQFIPTQNVETSIIRSPLASTTHGFLYDSRQDILEISEMYSDSLKHQSDFAVIAKHYNSFCLLHKDFLANHNNHYPFISQADLDNHLFNNPETKYQEKIHEDFACCDNPDQNHQLSKNTGAMLNRSQFIASIMQQYIKLEEAQTVKDTFDGYVGYLINNKIEKEKSLIPINDLQFQKLIEANRLTLHKFMQDTCNIYGFPPKRAVQVIMNLVKGELSSILKVDLIIKWYIQSKTCMTNEHTDWSKCLNYSIFEFLRFVYKLSDHLLNQDNHTTADKVFLKKHETLFKESAYVKFKYVLSMILKENMIDPDEPEKKVKSKKIIKGGKK